MSKQKILITVKTYPTPSVKYEELVCTAGIQEDGSWVRIYPIPFRKKGYEQQYQKYQWIEVDLVKNTSDFRPESFRPKSIDTDVVLLNKIGTENCWAERKRHVLKQVYTSLSMLLQEAKDQRTSLAVFKPASIQGFQIKPVERKWNERQKTELKTLNLFEEKGENFEIVRKLPYKFSYVFKDEDGKKSTMMIEDWEIGQLYWNCLARHKGDEEKACIDVHRKYFDDFAKTKDIYLFLGTTLRYHAQGAPNPFIIIGTFHPKFVTQDSLF